MNMSAMLRQFSIRTRMVGAIAMVLALLLLLGGVGYQGINSLREQNHQLAESSGALAKQAAALAQHLESGAAKEGGAQQDKLISEAKATLKQSAEVAQAVGKGGQDNSLMIFIIVLSLGAVIVVPLTLLNMQSICTPLAQADALANAIANGDLTGSSVPIEGEDEASHLMRSLQHMQQALQSLVSQLRTSADSIRTASVEIASGNQDLSNRTEQTASNLQQAASSMVQLTGTVRQTADSARTANQLANSASSAAAKGGEVVGQVVSTMDEINTSSKKISDIIGVIDSIAFQTNILALNAAVEAARAGEQGRGFAVVASEVRSLAQRSAEAAREIKTLIGASVERVEVGSRLVQEAGSSMTDIVSSVQRVSDIIGEITAAASEQSDGIEQVNQSVVQLDQMTQQNAALVEESAAAAESLKDQAEQLTDAVGKFRTSTTGAGRPQQREPSHKTPATGAVKMPGKVPAKSPTKPPAKPLQASAASRPAPAARPVMAPAAAAAKAPAPAPSSQAESEWESF